VLPVCCRCVDTGVHYMGDTVWGDGGIRGGRRCLGAWDDVHVQELYDLAA
jgi:hypothetical protein